MSDILQWETSRSWTGKADVEDIEKLRNDLAALEQLVAAKADQGELRAKADLQRLTPTEEALSLVHTELAGIKQYGAETSRQLQEQLEQLDRWVKSGAVEACLQALCKKQSQTIEELCSQHREKMSEVSRVAEATASEIRSISKACQETMQTTAEAAAEAQSSAGQSLQAMTRLSAETAEHSAAAKNASQEAQALAAQERDSRQSFDHAIQKAAADIDRTRIELLELAAGLFALKESVTAAAEQSQLGAAASDKNLKLTGQLLDEGAQQLARCKEALERAQATQASQEDLARRMSDNLTKAKSYRIELKSVALKTEVNLAKAQQRNQSFWGRLHWLLRGSPESF
jgi:hypothetical protein